LQYPEFAPTSSHQNDNVPAILKSDLPDAVVADILTKLKVPVPGRFRKHWLADIDIARARKRLAM